jgi:hypothetical protein
LLLRLRACLHAGTDINVDVVCDVSHFDIHYGGFTWLVLVQLQTQKGAG